MDVKSKFDYSKHLYFQFLIKSNHDTMTATVHFPRSVFLCNTLSVKENILGIYVVYPHFYSFIYDNRNQYGAATPVKS